VLGGQPKLQKKATLRAADAESAGTVSVYVDREEPVAYRLSWYAPGRKEKGALQLLDSDFLFIEPPPPPGEGAATGDAAEEGG